MTSPLHQRRTNGLKYSWKVWRFERQARKVTKARNKEIARLVQKK